MATASCENGHRGRSLGTLACNAMCLVCAWEKSQAQKRAASYMGKGLRYGPGFAQYTDGFQSHFLPRTEGQISDGLRVTLRVGP